MTLRNGGLRLGVVLVAVAVGVLGVSASAFAETKTESFTEQGVCKTWTVPSGVTSVSVVAVGGAGATAANEDPGAGGKGDELTAEVSVQGGEKLDVCDGFGGGKGGESVAGGGAGGGNGGGGSGVARGENFSTPLLVAGGGGGGGELSAGLVDGNLVSGPGAPGGAAGEPGGESGVMTKAKVEGGSSSNEKGPGVGAEGEPGITINDPPQLLGHDGAGGGGGGGYVGGGGGSVTGGGGAGGTDFCEDLAPVSGCSTNKGAGTGSGEVTITYSAPPACSMAEGTGTYKRRGEKGRFTVRDHLSTTLTGTQMLSVNTESGEARFGLTKLTSANCEALAGGGFKFSGEGPSRYYRKTGYNISFSITVKGAKASFYAKLSNGSIVVNEEENALTKSSEVIQ
jgi:hypothetical protein